MKDYVVFDLETTGFSPYTNEIIEIGAYKVKDGMVVDKFCTFVRPVQYIPLAVQNLTHITMDMVADCEPIETVIAEFYEFCERLPLLGHNLRFDYSFAVAKCKASGLDFTLNSSRCGIDTCELARKYLKLRDNKLGTVSESMHINLEAKESFHRASYDAYVTKLIYDRFILQYPLAPGISIPELLDKPNTRYGKAEIEDVLPLE